MRLISKILDTWPLRGDRFGFGIAQVNRHEGQTRYDYCLHISAEEIIYKIVRAGVIEHHTLNRGVIWPM
jgi:hypothetical protein